MPPHTHIADLGLGSINAAGTVAFEAQRTDGSRAIYTGNGGALATVVTTGPDFLGFGGDGPAINDAGAVAFWALLPQGPSGIFTGPGPLADKVIATGDALAGSTVVWVDFRRWGLNNAGQIAFVAWLADGTAGVFRAEPPPAVAGTLAVGGLPSAGNPVRLKRAGAGTVATTTTDDTGAYGFDPVSPATYKIEIRTVSVPGPATVEGRLRVHGDPAAGNPVLLRNMATRAAFRTTRGAGGDYAFAAVPPGTYRVLIKKIRVP